MGRTRTSSVLDGRPRVSAARTAEQSRDSESEVVVGVAPRFFHGWKADYRAIWAYRELLVQLVRKELKVKYKESFLGFLWTLARPMFQIAIYYLAFTVFLGNKQPEYAIFIFSGLVVWTLFTDILGGSTGAIVGNGALIKKTYFPREMFPLSIGGAALVNFLFQMVVLAIALAVTSVAGDTFRFTRDLLLVPLAVLVTLVFGIAMGLFLAAATVYLRDIQHLIEIILLAWFWVTPIVYPAALPLAHLAQKYPLLLQVYLANPMTQVVSTFQRAFYTVGPQYLYQGNVAARLCVSLVVSVVLAWLGQRVFAKLSANFAQEL